MMRAWAFVQRLFGRDRERRTDGGDSGQATDARDGGTDPIPSRVHAERDGGFVVFHVGMRVNRLWKPHRWLPLFLVAPRMVRELRDDPDSGLLSSRTVLGPGIRNIQFIQHWESFGALRAYARDSEFLHLSGWESYNRSAANDHADVGIWHETYLVREGDYETVYNNMPPHGLGTADGSTLVPAIGNRESAAKRLGRNATPLHSPPEPE